MYVCMYLPTYFWWRHNNCGPYSLITSRDDQFGAIREPPHSHTGNLWLSIKKSRRFTWFTMNGSQAHDVPMSWTSHHDPRGAYSKVGTCSAGRLDFVTRLWPKHPGMTDYRTQGITVEHCLQIKTSHWYLLWEKGFRSRQWARLSTWAQGSTDIPSINGARPDQPQRHWPTWTDPFLVRGSGHVTHGNRQLGMNAVEDDH
jgi:hypothetical protein